MRARRIDGERPRAACADQLHLVDAAGDSPGSKEAEQLKRLCRTCPIARDCLTTALTSNQYEWGIWGATSPYTRTTHGAPPAPNTPKARDEQGRTKPRNPCALCDTVHNGNCRNKDLAARIRKLTA